MEEAHEETILTKYTDDPQLAEIIRDFVASLDQKVADFRSLLTRRETGELERLAHQIKGVGGMYGYPCLTETASLIEQAAREGQDVGLLAELIEEFAVLCEQISKGLKRS